MSNKGVSRNRAHLTVRDATFRVLRELGTTSIFANPGSTEISFLAGLPEDVDFYLGLHEGSVVGMATGWAMASGRPALVNLHTTAGLANAAGALATARANRAPLVVVVGQQDRRHLAHEPFLAGHLEGLVGEYPVWSGHPVRAEDVPGAIRRAHHQAVTGKGPALVTVPMDDWDAPVSGVRDAAARELLVGPSVAGIHVERLVAVLEKSRNPAVVVGAGNDDPVSWSRTVELVEHLGAPVWQEAFGARAGFPQDHPAFAGHLPPGRADLRAQLAEYDVVLVVGAPVFRQYPWEDGDLVPEGITVVQVTEFADEANGSVADLSVVARPSEVIGQLIPRLSHRTASTRHGIEYEDLPEPSVREALRPGHVFDLLRRELPENTILVEETPSSRPELHRRLPARAPLGFVSAAAGGLGFGLPAAVGLRLGEPHRPVVAVLGDGSSMYGIQGLWSSAHYGIGVLFVVLVNNSYAIMDQLAEASGRGRAPWPSFGGLSVARIAEGMGCRAVEVSTYDEVSEALSSVVPALAGSRRPTVLAVTVAKGSSYT